MQFCPTCGTRNEGGAFCFQCGTALTTATDNLAPTPEVDIEESIQEGIEEGTDTIKVAPPADVSPAGPSPAAAPPTAFVPPASPPTPTVRSTPPSAPPGPASHPPAAMPPPRPVTAPNPPPLMPTGAMPSAPPPLRPANPLEGLPISDFVRDGAALIFLFASLGTTWQFGDNGGDLWWVVLSVVIAALALVVPYLARFQLVPGWAPAHYRLTKLGLGLPLAASAIAAVINELVHVGDELEGGIGVAVAFALAGLTLVIQPRHADDPQRSEDQRWHTAAVAAGVVAIAVGCLQFVAFLLDNSDDVFDEPLWVAAMLVLSVGLLLTMFGWPLFEVMSRRPGSATVWSVIGFTFLSTALLGQADDGSALFFWPSTEKWSGALGYGGTFAIGAAVGLCAAAAVGRLATPSGIAPYARWTRTASSALLISAAGSTVALVGFVLGVVIDLDDVSAAKIIVMVLILVIVASTCLAQVLAADPARNRITVLILVGATVVCGLITMGVINGEDLGIEGIAAGAGGLPITGWMVAAWVSLPALAAFALTVPPPVRAALGPLVSATSAGPSPAAPPQQPPAPPPFG